MVSWRARDGSGIRARCSQKLFTRMSATQGTSNGQSHSSVIPDSSSTCPHKGDERNQRL